MVSFYLKCRKNAESKNPKIARSNNRRIMFLSTCAVCDGKKSKSKFSKQKEASWSLSSLGIKTISSKIPLAGPLLF